MKQKLYINQILKQRNYYKKKFNNMKNYMQDII